MHDTELYNTIAYSALLILRSKDLLLLLLRLLLLLQLLLHGLKAG